MFQTHLLLSTPTPERGQGDPSLHLLVEQPWVTHGDSGPLHPSVSLGPIDPYLKAQLKDVGLQIPRATTLHWAQSTPISKEQGGGAVKDSQQQTGGR